MNESEKLNTAIGKRKPRECSANANKRMERGVSESREVSRGEWVKGHTRDAVFELIT